MELTIRGLRSCIQVRSIGIVEFDVHWIESTILFLSSSYHGSAIVETSLSKDIGVFFFCKSRKIFNFAQWIFSTLRQNLVRRLLLVAFAYSNYIPKCHCIDEKPQIIGRIVADGENSYCINCLIHNLYKRSFTVFLVQLFQIETLVLLRYFYKNGTVLIGYLRIFEKLKISTTYITTYRTIQSVQSVRMDERNFYLFGHVQTNIKLYGHRQS